MKTHMRGYATAKANDTNTGRMTVISVKVEFEPRLEMICTMIKPTTSSIMAALVSTTPSRLSERPLVARTVNVVPNDVEQSAAPAAKACTGVIGRNPSRAKDKPTGVAMPVMATAEDRKRLALRALKSLDRPPRSHVVSRTRAGWLRTWSAYPHRQSVSARCSPAVQSSAAALPRANPAREWPMPCQ
jgi:hypothetical protein